MSNDTEQSGMVRLSREVTYGLLVLNFAVFLYEQFLLPWNRVAFDQRFALSLDGIRAGHWWQFLSYQFLHGNWIHLILNLLFLDSLGPVLETTLGARRFLALYLISGALGGLVHLVGSAMSPHLFGHAVVGASAGLCGLLAALAAIYSEDRLRVMILFVIPLSLKAKYLLLIFGLVTLAGTLVPLGNVSHLAHLGGLVGGLWFVNLCKVEPVLQLGEEEPTRQLQEPPSTG